MCSECVLFVLFSVSAIVRRKAERKQVGFFALLNQCNLSECDERYKLLLFRAHALDPDSMEKYVFILHVFDPFLREWVGSVMYLLSRFR